MNPAHIVLLAALVVAGCSGPAPEVYLIPEGYVGPIVVDVGRADGTHPEVSGDTLIFRIPTSGVLLRSDAGVNDFRPLSYAYVDPSGHRTVLMPDNETIHPPEKVVHFGDVYWGASLRTRITSPTRLS